MSVCTKGFTYLRCCPRERGVGLSCTRRFSFHEFYNFLPLDFLIFNCFLENFFFTHDVYPHPHPRPLPTTHDPRHLRHLATLVLVHTRRLWNLGKVYSLFSQNLSISALVELGNEAGSYANYIAPVVSPGSTPRSLACLEM